MLSLPQVMVDNQEELAEAGRMHHRYVLQLNDTIVTCKLALDTGTAHISRLISRIPARRETRILWGMWETWRCWLVVTHARAAMLQSTVSLHRTRVAQAAIRSWQAWAGEDPKISGGPRSRYKVE